MEKTQENTPTLENNINSKDTDIKISETPQNKGATKIKTKTKPKLAIKSNIPSLDENNIENVFEENFSKINLDDLNGMDDVNYNTFLYEKELLNRNVIENESGKFTNLYPSLDDVNFNIKIAEKKEFNETKYDGKLYNIEEQAEKLCNADF